MITYLQYSVFSVCTGEKLCIFWTFLIEKKVQSLTASHVTKSLSVHDIFIFWTRLTGGPLLGNSNLQCKNNSTGEKTLLLTLFTWSSWFSVIWYMCRMRGWLLRLRSRCCLTACCRPEPPHLHKDTNSQVTTPCTVYRAWSTAQLQSDLNRHTKAQTVRS